MFGHKDAGLIETLLRFRAHGDAVKSKRASRKIEKSAAGYSVEALMRRETYFAVAFPFRWAR